MPSPVITFVSDLSSALATAVEQANEAEQAFASAKAQALATGSTVQQVLEENEEAAEKIETLASRIEGTMGSASTRLKELRRGIEQEAKTLERNTRARFEGLIRFLEEQNDPGSQGLAAALKAVKEGLTDAESVAQKFGDSMIFWEGEMVRVREVLRELAPSAGEVQSRLADLRKDIQDERLSTEDAIARLSELNDAYAAILLKQIEAYRQGAGSLEQLLQTAQDLQSFRPGTEAAVLAEELADDARRGFI